MLHEKMAPSPTSPQQDASADAQQDAVEQREAYEYWGYLFRADKTGSPKLKSLLRGLKEVMNLNYENNNNGTHETQSPASAPHEQPDLTPTQLAHFYRDLHGNYDQLFLATPNESIAFIYKSLGCLHSLQPLRHATQTTQMANGDRATAFTDPIVPALKTEGWIMWQTIQILLGPEEHAQFLREAVEKWDVKDVETGNVFPKILPRECFPREPDPHMVAWYEGVSERLRKEADAEEAAKFDSEGEDGGRPRRLRGRRDVEDDETDEESVDSRAPALAYFRNPLYRHSDGRPSIVRHSSKRPGLSPRQTMMDKGKEAVGTFGRIAKNVGSPYLWDGRGGGSRSGSAHNATAGGKRRQSHSHLHQHPHHEGGPPTSSGSDRRDHSHHRRRAGSSPRDAPQQRPTSAVSSSTAADDEWWENSEVGSPPPASHHNNHRVSPTAAAAVGGGLAAAATARHGHGHSRSHSQHVPPSRDGGGREGQHRRHRSAEPTPSAPSRDGEPADYFVGVAEARRGSAPMEENRRSSGESGASSAEGNGGGGGGFGRRPSTTPPPVPAGNGVGVSFGPSAGPLFASTVARHGSVALRGGRGGGPPGRDEGRRGSAVEGMMGRHSQHPHPPPHYQQDPQQHRHHSQNSQHRHHQDHPPPPSSRRDEGRRRESRYDDDTRRFESPRRSVGRVAFDDGGGGGRRRGGSRDVGGRGRRHADQQQDFYDGADDDDYDYPPPRRSGEDFGRRSGESFGRGSREDVGGRGSREDVGGGARRSGGRKQTRFAGDDGGPAVPAERGVSGRRYPDGSPWGARGGE